MIIISFWSYQKALDCAYNVFVKFLGYAYIYIPIVPKYISLIRLFQRWCYNGCNLTLRLMVHILYMVLPCDHIMLRACIRTRISGSTLNCNISVGKDVDFLNSSTNAGGYLYIDILHKNRIKFLEPLLKVVFMSL